REALARGLAVLHELLDGPHRLPVAVTHGHLLALVLHSIDPGFRFAGWSGLRNPDLFRLARDEPGPLSFARPGGRSASRALSLPAAGLDCRAEARFWQR